MYRYQLKYVEICLGADMACGSVKAVNNSHFTHFYGKKHPVLISVSSLY